MNVVTVIIPRDSTVGLASTLQTNQSFPCRGETRYIRHLQALSTKLTFSLSDVLLTDRSAKTINFDSSKGIVSRLKRLGLPS